VPSGRLTAGEVVAEGFGFFSANIRLFFHLVTIPWILSIAIRAIRTAISEESLAALLVEKAIDVLPTVMFMVAWQRVVLLGPQRVDGIPGLRWSSRESAYIGHLIKIAGATFVLLAAFMLTIWPLEPGALRPGAALDPEAAERYSLAGPLAAGFIISMVLALRVSWGLAATAVDVPFSPRNAWAYSRGSAWAIVGALFVTYFAGELAAAMAMLLSAAFMRGVLGAREAATVVAWTAAILASYAATAVIAGVQAAIFRRLTGWREGAPLPAPPGS